MAAKKPNKNPAAVTPGRKGGKNSRLNLTPAAAQSDEAKLQSGPLKDAGDKLETKKPARVKKKAK